MNNLNALRDEVYSINKSNGWHEEKRTFGELIALVHSEVSEALEDYRNGKGIDKVWYEYKVKDKYGVVMDVVEEGCKEFEGVLGKPCGIPSELADIVIRILDICGLYGWDIESKYNENELDSSKFTFLEKLNLIHVDLSMSYANKGGSEGIWILTQAVRRVEHICKVEEINLEQTIQEKLAYNRTRGYKHGGKVI